MAKRNRTLEEVKDRTRPSANGEPERVDPPAGAGDSCEPSPENLPPSIIDLGKARFKPKPMSELQGNAKGADWLWTGFISRGNVSLLSALWKCGKSTMLGHYLHKTFEGGELFGMEVFKSRVLYVSEEGEGLWKARREEYDIRDNVVMINEPFMLKPSFPEWLEMIDFFAEYAREEAFDVIVLDTLSDQWPVVQENDSSEIMTVLKPLRKLTKTSAVLLNHHLNKSGGQEFTAGRGGGGLLGFPDTLLEMRRYDPSDEMNRKRVIKGIGRWKETPKELVIELTDEGEYIAHGSRGSVRCKSALEGIDIVLSGAVRPMEAEHIYDLWPEEVSKPSWNVFSKALRDGAEAGRWRKEGTGKRGSPFVFSRLDFVTHP